MHNALSTIWLQNLNYVKKILRQNEILHKTSLFQSQMSPAWVNHAFAKTHL